MTAQTASAPPTGRSGTAPLQIMLCDDSPIARAMLARMLESDPGIVVAARTSNGEQALAEVKQRRFDAMLLDIEMPVMDGMQALPLLLRADPGLPIIMASSLTTRGAEIALRALRLGAADYLAKPTATSGPPDAYREELIAKVKGLARRRIMAMPSAAAAAIPSKTARAGTASAAGMGMAPPAAASQAVASQPAAGLALRPLPAQRPLLLAVGSSTGGPQALFTFFQSLGPRLNVPVVLTQHMPPSFTPLLAEHITRLGGLPCAEAVDGEKILPGRIYLAPGDKHLLVQGSHGALQARLSSDPPENFCRPAVDPMLRSANAACQGRVLTVMLTGMGQDGLDGTAQLVAAGGCALAQDEASSVVWGMPGAIAKAGLCHAVLPLPAMAPKVLQILGVTR